MANRRYRILVVDEDREAFAQLDRALGEPFYLDRVEKPEKALVNLRRKYYDAVLSELEFGSDNPNGVSLLKNLRQMFPHYVFVFFSSGNIGSEDAVEAIRHQVNGFLSKPLRSGDEAGYLENLLERESLLLKRSRTEDHRMSNSFRLMIPATEEDIIGATEIADQIGKLLYPTSFGNLSDFKIALYEALSNAKLYGSHSKAETIDLRIEFQTDRISCHVKDQGEGFKHGSFSGKPTALTGLSGIRLIKSLMDDCSFNSSGNEINFLKLLETGTARPLSKTASDEA